MWFRAMKPAPDGMPVTAPSGRALGARIPGDIDPDAQGVVHPRTGGMSVSPGSVWNIPHHRRPRGMGHGSTGPPGDQIFGMEAFSGFRLCARPDPARPDKHAFVEPALPMLSEPYQQELVATRPSWRRMA